jgi:hypothetical protein
MGRRREVNVIDKSTWLIAFVASASVIREIVALIRDQLRHREPSRVLRRNGCRSVRVRNVSGDGDHIENGFGGIEAVENCVDVVEDAQSE